jgi:hypothetical protein
MWPMSTARRTREQRLRRAAARQGLSVERSRQRDPRGLAFGTYRLVDIHSGQVVAGDPRSGYGLTLDQVEAYLDQRQG